MPYVKRKIIRKPKRTYKKRSTGVSNKVKNYVKKVIHNVAETKHAPSISFSDIEIAPYGYAGFVNTGTILNISSVLSGVIQGTTQGTRIGNQIRVKKLTFKGVIGMPSAATYGTSTKACFVKMFVGRLKSAVTTPIDLGNLFQNGGVSAPPSLLPVDMVKNVNKDAYTIYKTKIFKLSADTGVPFAPYGAGSFHLMQFFSFDLTKHFGKIKYDESLATATNAGCWCWFNMCNYDGTVVNVAVPGTIPGIEIHYVIDCSYDDL